MSFWPSSSWKIGSARTTSTTVAAIAERQGRDGDAVPPSGASRAARVSSGWVLPSWTRSELMCGPSAPSIAGSSVAAAQTATTTAIAAVKPSVRDQRDPGEGERAERDHDREAGEDDGAAGGRGGAGDRLAQLHPFGELQFVAGDDEQRVVDPDPEPDHRRQGRGDARHLDHVLEQADDRERAGEADHGGDDRQHHRRRRAEGEEQDDHRRGEADRLAGLGRGLGELLADVAADGGVSGPPRAPAGRRRGSAAPSLRRVRPGRSRGRPGCSRSSGPC